MILIPFTNVPGIGILIGEKAERGKGYAADALQVLIQYCFNYLLLNQIYCSINESNTISLHLFQQVGFRITGKKKNGSVGLIVFRMNGFFKSYERNGSIKYQRMESEAETCNLHSPDQIARNSDLFHW